MRVQNREISSPARILQFVLLTAILLIFGQMTAYSQIPEWAWVKQAGGTGMDIGYGVAVDEYGNVYVVGRQDHATFGAGETSETTFTNTGGFIAKYNSSGDLIWVIEIIGGRLTDIALNSYNDIFVLGWFSSSTTFAPGLGNEQTLTSSIGDDQYLAKYSTNGDFIWVTRIKSNTYEYGTDLAIDSRDYITKLHLGYEAPSVMSSYVRQFDNSGTYLWGDMEKDFAAICCDDQDNCYITGYIGHLYSTMHMVVYKYDTSGNQVQLLQTTGTSHSQGRDIVMGSDGFIYVSGNYGDDTIFGEGESNETTLPSGGVQYFLAKYYPDGDLVWAKKQMAELIAIDPGNYIYSAEYIPTSITFGEGQPNETTVGSVGNYEMYIAKYDSSGYFLWVKTEGGSESDEIYSLYVDSNGIAHVAGYFEDIVTFGAGESNETTLNSNGDEDIFVAQLGTVNPEISGVVFYYPSITMIEGAEINFSGLGSAYTVANGYYQMTVPFGWSGTAMVTHPGLVFDIPTRTYDFVSSNRVNQDYWVLGDALLPVSGYVTLSSNQQPLENVALTFDNGGGTVYSSDSAYYVNHVPYQWSGTVTPGLSGYVFDPSSRTYSNITAGQFNQDYTGSGTGVEEADAIPTKTELYANYPNPFNASTTLRYDLSRSMDVRLDIYDINGRLIRNLIKGRKEPGTFTVQWHGKDDRGLPVSSGIYTCRMTTEQNVFRQKLILIK